MYNYRLSGPAHDDSRLASCGWGSFSRLGSASHFAMKNPCSVLLAVVLLGCNAARPRTAALTTEQASDLAQRLANEEAQALYHCQPFHNGPSAQFIRGNWVWHDLRGQGVGDFEARVQFARDGTEPSVGVVLLDSRLIIPSR